MKIYNCPILVNSSDSFFDTWDPFFVLFDKYWPEYDGTIFLNTENAIYSSCKTNIVSTQVSKFSKEKLSWSDCLLNALDLINSEYIIYFQEDYFLNSIVDNSVVLEALDIMQSNKRIGHIALTKHGSCGPYLKSEYLNFEMIRQNAKYRISTQAGIWKVNCLKSYLQANESGWMFEIYGTWRANKNINDIFLKAINPPISYIHTGIIKGAWNPQIVSEFKLNNIQIDFQKRGFYKRNEVFPKSELVFKLLKRPFYFLKQFISNKILF